MIASIIWMGVGVLEPLRLWDKEENKEFKSWDPEAQEKGFRF